MSVVLRSRRDTSILGRGLALEALGDQQVDRLGQAGDQLQEQPFLLDVADPDIRVDGDEMPVTAAPASRSRIRVRPGHVDVEAVGVVLHRAHPVSPRGPAP